MTSPSRPTPAHAHIGQTMAWLQEQTQATESEVCRLRQTLAWLDSIIADDADEHQEKASTAWLAVEAQLLAAETRVATANQAVEALRFFHH